MQDDIAIVIIDDNFNPGGVHLQTFAEGTALSHEHAAAATQRTVNGLDDVSLSFAFGVRPVLVAGQDGGVGFPLIGEVPPVAPGHLLLKAPHRGLAPAAQHPGHDTAGPLDGQPAPEPAPELAPPAPHKGPQLVHFQHFPVFFRAQARHFFGAGAAVEGYWPALLLSLGNAHARNTGHVLGAALRIALAQQLVDLRVVRGFGHGSGHKTRLVAVGFALVAGVALTVSIPSNLVAAAFGAEVLRINHKAPHRFHPELDHRH